MYKTVKGSKLKYLWFAFYLKENVSRYYCLHHILINYLVALVNLYFY